MACFLGLFGSSKRKALIMALFNPLEISLFGEVAVFVPLADFEAFEIRVLDFYETLSKMSATMVKPIPANRLLVSSSL